MSYGGVYGGDKYPPKETGKNVTGTSIFVMNANTLDSVVGSLPEVFTAVKTAVLPTPPLPEYDTGRWVRSATELKVTSTTKVAHDVRVTVSGKLKSSATVNTGRITVRLNSTDGVGTGTTKTYAMGLTTAGTTVEAGFTVIGFFRSAENQTISLEVAKNFAGTLILESMIMELAPLW